MRPLRQSFFTKCTVSKICNAHNPACFACFVVLPESVLRHPFCEEHLRDLMKRFLPRGGLWQSVRKAPSIPAELHHHRGSFDKFDLDHLAVELLVKVENMRLHVFLKGADGRPSQHWLPWIAYPIVDAIGDVDPVGSVTMLSSIMILEVGNPMLLPRRLPTTTSPPMS